MVASDSPAPGVAKALAAIVLTAVDKRVLVNYEEGF